MGRLKVVLNDQDLPTNSKSKVFNMCILPVIRESTALTVKAAKKLRAAQRAIERSILGVTLRDYLPEEEMDESTHNNNSTIIISRRNRRMQDSCKYLEKLIASIHYPFFKTILFIIPLQKTSVSLLRVNLIENKRNYRKL